MIRKQFLNTIRKFKMIEKGETILVAVSGGGDSVVLLHLLFELSKSWRLKLGVLHVNHGLRGRASDQDEVFVKRLAHRLKIPCDTTRVAIKEKAKKEGASLEAAAREARYEFFEQTAKIKRATKIVLAHSMDDQAETVLMRLMTGTGLQGLQAIRPKRKLNHAYLVRPLIEIPREEIRKFAKENAIKFREDLSNQSRRFLRNRIRLELIPFIEKDFNPQVKRALARLPHLLDVDLTFLDKTAEAAYQKLARKKKNEIVFSKPSFLKLSPSIQFRLINRALKVLGGPDLDFDHWNHFWELLSGQPRFQFQLPKEIFAVVSSEEVRIKRAGKSFSSFSYSLFPDQTLYISELDLTLSCEALAKRPRQFRKQNKNFDILNAEKLSFPLTVRNRRPGDRFQPLGRTKPHKLKSFLIDERILREERDRLPLVLSKDTIAWVAGVRMAEPFKATPKALELVRLSVSPGNRR
jgi:tRNA(Ile)-lysidine synthase